MQDRFFEHMSGAGFEDFVRGERGSTTEHLSSLDYQIKKDTERLNEIKAKIEKEQVVYDTLHPEHKTFSEIDDMGKKGITGKYTVTKEDYDTLTSLAKEGISSRGKIRELKDENKRLWTKVFSLSLVVYPRSIRRVTGMSSSVIRPARWASSMSWWI